MNQAGRSLSRVTKLAFAFAFAFAPAAAFAQPNYFPSPGVSAPPTTLQPGETGSQAPAPPPAPAPAAKPNVVVVGPNGKVNYSPEKTTGPSGYYMQGGEGPARLTEPGMAGPAPENIPEFHVVRRGDTLWDICAYYFSDPWQWPKIWSYNPQITNPHWIYPSDLVRLLPKGEFATQSSQQPSKPELGAGTGSQQPMPPPQRQVRLGLRQTAFVEAKDLKTAIAISGSVDEKLLLGTGDEVYLSYPDGHPPQVGKTYSIYKPKQEVKGYGAYVRILGTLKVVSTHKGKRARGLILSSNREIVRGDKVGPLVREFKTVPPVPAKVNARATIVALLGKGQLIGQGRIVFVDLGKSSGIVPGNRMFVIRRGDAYPKLSKYTVGQDDTRFPARALGEVLIVQVGENISIGVVTLSVQEMGVGDVVVMQKH